MNLKIMTLNVLCSNLVKPAGPWSARLPLVLEVFSARPDIVGLQEATTLQLTDLEEALPDYALIPGPESGETRLPRLVHRVGGLLNGATSSPTHRRGEHCAILYRKDRFDEVQRGAFWLSRSPDEPGSVLPWTWLPRVVNWVRLQEKSTQQRVTFFCTHVDFLPWAPFRSARILRRMLDKHWDGSPQVLVGDFNTIRNSSAYRHFHDEPETGLHPAMYDAWLAAQERFGPDGTYHGGTGEVRWMGRLDRILFRPQLPVERAATVTHHRGATYPSDHYPVFAEIGAPS